MEAAVLFWILCAVAGAAMLSRYNRAGSGFLLGLLLGPIGLIIAWTMRDSAKLDEAPFCAELILAKARVCKHCGRDVEPLAPVEEVASHTEDRPWVRLPVGCERCGAGAPPNGSTRADLAFVRSARRPD